MPEQVEIRMNLMTMTPCKKSVTFTGIFILLLLLLPHGTCDTLSPEVQAWIDQGNGYYEQGMYTDAATDYQNAADLDPNSSLAHFHLGNALYGQGKAGDALSAYEKSLDLNPDRPDAWLNRGNALQQLGRYNEALGAYDQVLLLNPEESNAYYNRGLAYEALGNSQAAYESYEEVTLSNPGDAEAWNRKGVMLYNLGRFSEAVRAYDRALAISPSLTSARENREKAKAMVQETGGITNIPLSLPVVFIGTGTAVFLWRYKKNG